MRRFIFFTLLLSGLGTAAPAPAQEITLPDYTMEQRWNRLATLVVGWEAAVVAMGEAHGMTPTETGQWVGEFFNRSWLSGAEAGQFLRGMHRNFMSMPGAAVEVLSSTPTTVTARFNRPGDARLGAGRRSSGIPGKDINAMLQAVQATVADWVGVDYQRREDGDHDVVTLTTEYGPIQASDDLRWGRQSFLTWLPWLQYMALRMESGLSAREIGEADAKLYGPGWTSETPWQLLRGMIWNGLSDMNADCEILSASPTEVRAKCRQHYRQLVLNQQERFKVTPEDVFESGRAFAMGVADQRGLRWQETLENGYRMIVVTKK